MSKIDLSPVFPTRKEWTGEGLPPVGIDCEYQVSSGPWFKCNIRYVTTPPQNGSVEVVMFAPHLNGEQVGEVGDGSGMVSFRPIRTPEQIAAEVREKAIADMCATTAEKITVRSAGALYDAGYRKLEIMDN